MDQADTWAKRYRQITQSRDDIRTAAARGLKELRSAVIQVPVKDQEFSVLPLGPKQATELTDLAHYVQLPPITPGDQELLHQLEVEVPHAVADAHKIKVSGLGAKRIPEDAQEAADYLFEYVPWGLAVGLDQAMDRITPNATGPEVSLSQALRPENGLGNALKAYGTPELIPSSTLRSRLATFSAAEGFAKLARAIGGEVEYVVVCSPAGATAMDLLSAIDAAAS